ncbi:helix-turn-helix domain-containing protein [Streptomyces gobiensis]|uniref:helix-turn-helix domain-containing protein n=1 Tax=Streptomyces gobiensis TaxID=2875706 RepID=UPI001E2B328D|nr:helix-turn-helix transcriptional regulator [Streptomyces gobiensis]UGY93579.1 helix-turn-helix domain-containing protein [Streptomyces gobiensis]
MSVNNSQPPMAWRYGGNQLKMWRTNAGVTREELGNAAGYSPDTVKSMEQGVRMPTPRLLDVADDLLQANGLLRAAKQYLRREKFPSRSQDYMRYEAEAIGLLWYESLLVPGLLQTEEYVRALIGSHFPPKDVEWVDERVSARLERQQLLTRKNPVAFSFVVYEAILRTPVGGSEAHKRQLLHLLEVTQLRNVSLQVLPFNRAMPAALEGPMVLLETEEHEHFSLADGQGVSQFTSDPTVVSTLTQRYGKIREEALCTEESLHFIERMVDDL